MLCNAAANFLVILYFSTEVEALYFCIDLCTELVICIPRRNFLSAVCIFVSWLFLTIYASLPSKAVEIAIVSCNFTRDWGLSRQWSNACSSTPLGTG